MLSRITIRNLVIVRTLDLAFSDGMTALTGETGAGKSILIDALGLALGDRADSGMIRAGADKAEVSVDFDLASDSAALAWLEHNDLAADGECLLRRVLVREGRSRAYINGSPATQALLRELGGMLVDIHGQHAHQSLLQAAAQRRLLDAYAGLGAQAREVAQRHKAWREHEHAFAELRGAGGDRASRLDYLRFQIAEMESVVCDADTLRDLENEHARLAHAERLRDESSAVLNALSDEPSLSQSLHRAIQTVGRLAELDAGLDEARELLTSAGIQVDEAAGLLRHYQDRVELDPERLQALDQQLGRLHDLARKHRVDADALGELLQTLQTEVDTLDNTDSRLAQLEQQMQDAERDYRAAAEDLGRARVAAGAKLSARVTDSMQALGMRGGRLTVQVDSDGDRPTASGLDQVSFRVAANPGQAEGALSDVASGGELSRISLAIQVATANCGSVATLIFDEVDVGIGRRDRWSAAAPPGQRTPGAVRHPPATGRLAGTPAVARRQADRRQTDRDQDRYPGRDRADRRDRAHARWRRDHRTDPSPRPGDDRAGPARRLKAARDRPLPHSDVRAGDRIFFCSHKTVAKVCLTRSNGDTRIKCPETRFARRPCPRETVRHRPQSDPTGDSGNWRQRSETACNDTTRVS